MIALYDGEPRFFPYHPCRIVPNAPRPTPPPYPSSPQRRRDPMMMMMIGAAPMWPPPLSAPSSLPSSSMAGGPPTTNLRYVPQRPARPQRPVPVVPRLQHRMPERTVRNEEDVTVLSAAHALLSLSPRQPGAAVFKKGGGASLTAAGSGSAAVAGDTRRRSSSVLRPIYHRPAVPRGHVLAAVPSSSRTTTATATTKTSQPPFSPVQWIESCPNTTAAATTTTTATSSTTTTASSTAHCSSDSSSVSDISVGSSHSSSNDRSEWDEQPLQQRKATVTTTTTTTTTAGATASTASPSAASGKTCYYTGCVSLALDSDEEALSPVHCYMRKYCVEAFSAGIEDAKTHRSGRSHSRRVEPGQVGIRCVHCKHRRPSDRQERAVCFPSSLKNIYHSIETWQRRHSLVCRDIPPWVKTQLAQLMHVSRSSAGGRRLYWEEAAQQLGMVDTSRGLRFIRPPGGISNSSISRSGAPHPPLSDVEEDPVGDPSTNTPMDVDESERANHAAAPTTRNNSTSCPIVVEEDRADVTDYLYLLMQQMESCQFSEQDRVGGRSKVKDCPLGFPGLQCRHCGGKAGCGRYFPNSVTALTSANSDRNIFNHIAKCRKCPPYVRDELEHLQEMHHGSKNKRGSRKLFFERVWARLHG